MKGIPVLGLKPEFVDLISSVYPPLWRRGKVTASHLVALALIPSRVGIFNFSLGLQLGGMVEQKISRSFLFQIYLG